MHIDHEIKLDFKDVLIRPKRSALPSRAEVDLMRKFTFKHSANAYHGVPVIAANMDTVGTFEMARAFAPFGLSVALHKHYSDDKLVAFFKTLKKKSNAFYSMGITKADRDKFARVMRRGSNAIRYVCIDVANGYTESFVEFVARFRDAYPQITLMAGNVVTGEMTEELILSGADIV
jgi:GMP reductase